MKRLLVSLSDAQHAALRRLAYERETTIAELIREALDHTFGTDHGEIRRRGRQPRQQEES